VLAGRYRVDAAIGRGGFATVYRGHHLRLDSPVAIKVLRFADDSPAEARALVARRFDEECRVLTRLRHEHIVRTLDQGLTEADAPEDARPYLVTELCSDGTLETLLKPARGKGFAISIAWPLMKAILEGLAYAHAQGVAHRDLKPQNLMLARDTNGRFTPRLIDFGIAKLFDADDRPGSGATASQVPSVCTPNYAAPEQCVGARTGPWTDVHAVGLIFVEMLTGNSAYPHGDLRDTVMAAIAPERPTPKRIGVDVGAFEPILLKALALRPMDRYRDAGELLDACLSVARELRLETVRESQGPRTPPRSPASPLGPVSSELAMAETVLARQPAELTVPLGAAVRVAPAPARRPRWLFWLVPAALAAVLVFGLLAYRFTRAAIFVGNQRTLRGVEVSFDEAANLDWLRVRAEAQGYHVSMSRDPRTSYLAITDGTGMAATVQIVTSSTPTSILVQVGQQVVGDGGSAAAYGIAGNRAVLVIGYGRGEPVRRAFNLITRGVQFDVVGDNFGGPNPAKAAADAQLDSTFRMPR